jgi:hypothetical protein
VHALETTAVDALETVAVNVPQLPGRRVIENEHSTDISA